VQLTPLVVPLFRVVALFDVVRLARHHLRAQVVLERLHEARGLLVRAIDAEAGEGGRVRGVDVGLDHVLQVLVPRADPAPEGAYRATMPGVMRRRTAVIAHGAVVLIEPVRVLKVPHEAVVPVGVIHKHPLERAC